MRIKENIIGDVTVLMLSGKMMNDPSTATLHPYVKELIGNGRIQVVVDLGRVKWFYSTGLGALLASYTSLRSAGGELKLARPTRKIYSVLMQTELTKVFEHFKSVDEAVQSFSA